MGAPVMVDLEPCLDLGGLDCCGDSVALEVLAHHRCLSAQAGSGGSTVGLRQGTVGAQLATKQSLNAKGTCRELDATSEIVLSQRSVDHSILVFDRESENFHPIVFIVKEFQRFFGDSDETPHRRRCISWLVCSDGGSSSFSSSHPAADRHVSPVPFRDHATV